jgi:hypothetical protein
MDVFTDIPGSAFSNNNLFYHPEYLRIQGHDNLRIYRDKKFCVGFALKGGRAVSLPGGLFGSFEKKGTASIRDFTDFFSKVREALQAERVKHMEIIHPADIYGQFAPAMWLEEMGMHKAYTDVNYAIAMDSYWTDRFHDMQQRKLKDAEKNNLRLRMNPGDELSEVYQFLHSCREDQGLVINITLEKLERMFEKFPAQYHAFSAYVGDEMVSSLVMVVVSRSVVYYYLPGTAAKYKSMSPMVPLLHFVGENYRAAGIQIMDLGVASVKGKVQEGLATFKERIGGTKGEKPKYELVI